MTNSTQQFEVTGSKGQVIAIFRVKEVKSVKTPEQLQDERFEFGTNIPVSVNISKAFTFLVDKGQYTAVYDCNKKAGFEEAAKFKQMFVNITHTRKVVCSTIKKFKSLGFNVEEVVSYEYDEHMKIYLIVTKNA